MLKNYLRIAYAVFMRRKFFTFISLFGITFTLAILMASIGIIDNTLGKMPPEVNQDRSLNVMSLYFSRKIDESRQTMQTVGISKNFLQEMSNDLPGVEAISFHSNRESVTSYLDGQQLESQLKYVDMNFWRILQFDFLEGRSFTKDEMDNADYVAVINESTRSKYFGESSALGKTMALGGNTYRIVGVVEDVPFVRQIPYADIWIPMTLDIEQNTREQIWGSYIAMILAKDRGYFGEIKDEFKSRVAEFQKNLKGADILVCIPETLFESVARNVLTEGDSDEDATFLAIIVIISIGILFMLLPTVNLVNLNIGRIAERASEIGVRRAFGAPTRSLIHQFIVENVLLCLVGGVIALPSAYLILGLISGMGLIPFSEFSVNYRVFGYALLVTVFFGVFSGVYPAWRMSRMHPVDALRGGAA